MKGFFQRNKILLAVIMVMIVTVIAALLLRKWLRNMLIDDLKKPNVQAFLRVIRFAEGTAGPDGYRTMFTGKKFDSFVDHPRINNCAGSLCSTAAGAYQFLSKTWDYLRIKLNLNDFSPENQDLAALELIREKGALNDVINGNFEAAIAKTNKTWASLPGSPYGQPTKTMAELKSKFQDNGGNFA